MIITSPSVPGRAHEHNSVFLAGGITGCPNWQADVATLLDAERYDVYNPRRAGMVDATGDIAREQIKWEYEALARCAHLLFWFPTESLCPIALLEYGKALQRLAAGELRTLIVGHDPGYQRAYDLEAQLELVNDDLVGSEDRVIAMARDSDHFAYLVEERFGRRRPATESGSDQRRRRMLFSIREPTAEMLRAGRETPGMKTVDNILRDYAVRTGTQPLAVTVRQHGYPLAQAWRAMIDELLKGV